MHDVTEGGVATALAELSEAGGFGLFVTPGEIPVLEETLRIAGALGIDPFGLIGSGSLLICCRPAKAPGLLEAIENLGIRAQRIGEVLDRPPGIETDGGGPFPSFEVDEITRLFG
jgi:hydrogenase maturation factor